MNKESLRVTINMTVSLEFKDILRKLAKDQNRSMTSYIEWLVLQDAKNIGHSCDCSKKLFNE